MQRWLTGIPLAIAVVLLLLFAPIAYPKCLIVGLSLIGAWEFFSMTFGSKVTWLRMLACPLTLAGTGVFVFLQSFFAISLFVYVVFVLAFLIQLQGTDDVVWRVRSAAFFVLGVLYNTFLFGFLTLIFDADHYLFWIFLLLVATFMADTGAYLVGKKWGKNKLAPLVSPGKTVEGLLGGVVGAIIGAWGVKLIFWPEFHPGLITLLGVGLALIGLLGDLSESLLKRAFGVKDSGTILPGHGGLLDRVDALLFNAPWIYTVATIYSQIT